MTPLEITRGERAGGRRRAGGELAAIGDAQGDLGIIAWTLAWAGGSVAGQVSGPASAERLRGAFDAGRVALRLSEHREVTLDGGAILPSPTVDRNPVRAIAATTVVLDEDGEVRL